jgi:rubrerythrin
MKIKQKKDEFVIVDFDEIEAYKIACKIEKDGIDFYKKLAGLVGESVRKMADFLIEEEERHLRVFEDCLYEARQRQEDTFEEDDLFSVMDYGVFYPYKSMEDIRELMNDSKKVLRLGLVIEDRSIKLYSACEKKVSSQSTREALRNIIEQEKRHKNLLEDMIKEAR